MRNYQTLVARSPSRQAYHNYPAPWIPRAVPAIVGVVTLGFLAYLGFALLATGLPYAFQLQFNPFALLSLLSVIINITALVLIARIKEKTEELPWFAMHLLSLAVWAAAEMMVRLSATVETASFWLPMVTLGSAFVPISLYMFTLAYTNPERSHRPLTFLGLVSVSLLFIYTSAHTSLVRSFGDTAAVASWGFIPQIGPAYGMLVAWIFVLCVACLIMLGDFRRRIMEPALRRQSTLFLVAITIPVFGGMLTEGIPPVLGIKSIPPLSTALASAMGFTICIGIIKYRLFSFTPNVVAAEILGTMNEAVIGLKPDFRLSYANAGAERLLGYSRAELAHKRLTDFLTQRLTMPQLKKGFLANLEDQDYVELDSIDLMTADKHIVTVKASITKIDNGGHAYGYLLVLTNITEIAQATAIIEHKVAEQTAAVRQAKAQLDSSINSLELGFIITDDRPEVIMVNRPAHQLFCNGASHAPTDCRNVTIKSLGQLHDAGTSIEQALAVCLRNLKPRRLKLVEYKDRSWHVFITPVVDGKLAKGATIIFQDVTEEQILARSRDEFFSIASHELRTPLTAIKGSASMMLEYYSKALKDPSLHEMVSDIRESSDRLISVVNDFLDASRLEQGRIAYRFESLSLSQIIERILYEFRPAAAAKGLRLQAGYGFGQSDSLPDVIADRNRLKQILLNLIGNAVKFTASGDITVAATRDGNMIKLTVSDTGQGIAPAMRPLLFRKFQQASESLLTRDAAGGTGLGLYISKLLAAGMGGRLVLEYSEPGKGSAFSLTLPVATPERLQKLTTEVPVVDTASGLTINA